MAFRSSKWFNICQAKHAGTLYTCKNNLQVGHMCVEIFLHLHLPKQHHSLIYGRNAHAGTQIKLNLKFTDEHLTKQAEHMVRSRKFLQEKNQWENKKYQEQRGTVVFRA